MRARERALAACFVLAIATLVMATVSVAGSGWNHYTGVFAPAASGSSSSGSGSTVALHVLQGIFQECAGTDEMFWGPLENCERISLGHMGGYWRTISMLSVFGACGMCECECGGGGGGGGGE